jgi:hypothetical protein
MPVKWSDWASRGKPHQTAIGSPFVQRNQDGRLELFVNGAGDASGIIFNLPELVPNGGWREEWLVKGTPLPTVVVKFHAVGRNADGRLEIFAMGDDGGLWQKWQVAPNNGWSEWKTLGTPGKDISLGAQFTVGINQDGRQEVFAVGSDGNVWQIFQTAPNSGWSEWVKRGQPPVGIRHSDRISVGRNLDLRQELFVMGADEALWHVWQLFPNAGWSEWQSLGKPRDAAFPEPRDRDISQPTVQKNADGHLEVFAPGDGAFCNRWQEMPLNPPIKWRHEGWNAKPKPKTKDGVEVALTSLDAAINVGGQLNNHLEVFGVGEDGTLWHAWQIDQAPFWSPWESLGSPPPGIREGDRLAIGTNQDGRLEVFLMGQDSAVWHTWQMR